MNFVLRSLLLFALCMHHCLTFAQTAEERITGNLKAKTLIQEGNDLWSQQKVNEAADKFHLANEADPSASGPLSHLASLYLFASTRTKQATVEEYREEARSYALRAIQLNSSDPLAQEVLRELISPSIDKENSFSQESLIAFNEGERLFQRKDFREALKQYEFAFEKSPTFAKAILYAGDCYFQLGEYAAAEKRYNLALDVDPSDYQAWRFLAHAHLKMGHPPEIIKLSLLRSIEAQPNYMPAWDWYAELSEAEGKPLRTFSVKRLATVRKSTNNSNNAYTVNIEESLMEDKKSSANTAWIRYGLIKASLLTTGKAKRIDANSNETEVPLNAFECEVLAWKVVLNDKEMPPINETSPLYTLRQIVLNGDTEAAIFLFYFDESFRADFDEWKKAHPNGVRNFIEKYSLKPSLTP